VDFGAGRDRVQDESSGLFGVVGDLRFEAAAVQCGCGAVEAGAVGWPLELEVERTGGREA
jgi:hypothetical protein